MSEGQSNPVEQAFIDAATALFVFGVNVVSAIGQLATDLIRAFPG